jgi:hypothetical protein
VALKGQVQAVLAVLETSTDMSAFAVSDRSGETMLSRRPGDAMNDQSQCKARHAATGRRNSGKAADDG